MQRKMILLFFIILSSCANIQRNNTILKKHLIYFNYTTQELCQFDTESGLLNNRFNIDFDIRRFNRNKHGCLYRWYCNDKNIYLMENYVDEENMENSYIKIFCIDMDFPELTEIFYIKEIFENFCIVGDSLYLMSYVGPSRDNTNKEKNYIISYNLSNGHKLVVNFNESLSEKDKLYASAFRVNENNIVMNGWNRIIMSRYLYLYNMETKMIKIIDNSPGSFFIAKNNILYIKMEVDEDSVSELITTFHYYGNKGLAVYDFNKKNKVLLYEINPDYHEILIVNEDTIVYIDGYRKNKNYYIENLNKKDRKLLFSSRDNIVFLGTRNIAD